LRRPGRDARVGGVGPRPRAGRRRPPTGGPADRLSRGGGRQAGRARGAPGRPRRRPARRLRGPPARPSRPGRLCRVPGPLRARAGWVARLAASAHTGRRRRSPLPRLRPVAVRGAARPCRRGGRRPLSRHAPRRAPRRLRHLAVPRALRRERLRRRPAGRLLPGRPGLGPGPASPRPAARGWPRLPDRVRRGPLPARGRRPRRPRHGPSPHVLGAARPAGDRGRLRPLPVRGALCDALHRVPPARDAARRRGHGHRPRRRPPHDGGARSAAHLRRSVRARRRGRSVRPRAFCGDGGHEYPRHAHLCRILGGRRTPRRPARTARAARPRGRRRPRRARREPARAGRLGRPRAAREPRGHVVGARAPERARHDDRASELAAAGTLRRGRARRRSRPGAAHAPDRRREEVSPMTEPRTRKRPAPRQPKSRLGAEDLHLFNEGTHYRLAEKLGAHPAAIGKRTGTRFAVWAPSARAVSVIGDWNGWTPGADPLSSAGGSGIWEGFVGDVGQGATYKFAITSGSGEELEKADPFARYAELPPKTASIVWDLGYEWGDDEWMRTRAERSALDAPISIYELHLGSWRRNVEEGNRPLTYRELAGQLPAYAVENGFTHVELLPIMEHPYTGSWGYQTTGYFAPTSRYGTPQDFMALVDALHAAGVGVILDWVPSHFATDKHGLASFDGTHLFEHADPRQGFHPDWGSFIFNYGRNEVRSFLLSSA